jgi:RNA-directed DNA polymerase
MQPLDPQVYYGISDRAFLDVHDVQMDLLPDKLHQLRWKLHQKAKNEPKFRFYALYDRVYRMDVLEAAWKHVGKKGKAPGIDGMRAEDVLAEENGVETSSPPSTRNCEPKAIVPRRSKGSTSPKLTEANDPWVFPL